MFLFSWSANSQTLISGIKNDYTKVITMLSNDKIVVESTVAFKANDTVLIIQMKGANFDIDQNVIIAMKSTGKYEFQAIQSVNIATQQIKFQHFFINKYDPTQCVQLVRIPSYQSVIISGPLTASPWNGKTGGIVAVFANDTLELKANISADATGFIGGDTTNYDIQCSLLPEERNYSVNSRNRSGLKGEGIIWNNFTTIRGNGAIANAGGGGNNKHSGGGGGAGFGTGGLGGMVSLTCNFGSGVSTEGEGGAMPEDYLGNKGALVISDTTHRDRIFVGAGGGGSSGLAPMISSKGGNGGGIVFIITRFLKTNGFNISANGENISSIATSDAGNGGGGGGGSVIMAFDSLTGPLNIMAKGGNGGKTINYNSGQGGGGGGGLVWLSPAKYSIENININGGDPGLNQQDNKSTAYGGTDGDTATKLNPVLNGFLFNILGSSQHICFHEIPQIIIGSSPRGGDGNYIYTWQKKTQKTLWGNIPGAISKNYQSSNLDDTTFIRRIVTVRRFVGAIASDIVSDTSKFVLITVIPEIKNNIIQPDTAICSGLKPVLITGSVPIGGDGNAITYKWENSLDGDIWKTIGVSGTGKNLQNTSNTETIHYRRKAINNICSPPSNSVLITIYPVINPNTALIDSSQTVCMNSTPKEFTGKNGIVPSGGAGSYIYKWEKSITDSTNWTNTGITTAAYNPAAHNQQIYYRRIVFSGLNNTCKDTSNTIKISVVPRITGNILESTDQTICQFTNPFIFTGSMPSGGDGQYRYQWNILNNEAALWDSITTNSLFKSYSHSKINVEGIVKFKRIIRSGLYDCCLDTSNSITVTVQPNIKNNVIGYDSTICYGQTPAIFVPVKGPISGGDNINYNLTWQKHVKDSIWHILYEAHNNPTFTSGILNKTSYFTRIIKSGVCTDTSNVVTIGVLPALKGNVLTSSFNKFCKDSIPKTLYAESLTGGNENFHYTWITSDRNTPEHIIPGATNAEYVFRSPLYDTTVFKRIAMSGLHDCCSDTSNSYPVLFVNRPIETTAITTIDTTFTFTLGLNARPLLPHDSGGIWNAIQDNNIIFSPDNATSTTVDNLKFGKNTVTWTLYSSKACPPTIQNFLIDVTDIIRYTGFSPNGDNLNEYFVIDGLETNNAIEYKDLTVFNRWGNVVYSNHQYDNSWNGHNMNGEPVPDDTYYYILKVQLKNTDQHLYKGFVVIKR